MKHKGRHWTATKPAVDQEMCVFPVKEQHHPTGSKVSHLHFMNKNSAARSMTLALFFAIADVRSQIPAGCCSDRETWRWNLNTRPSHSINVGLTDKESCFFLHLSVDFLCVKVWGGVDLLSGVYIIWSKCMLHLVLSPNESAHIQTLKQTYLRYSIPFSPLQYGRKESFISC